MSEREIQRQVVTLLRKAGWVVTVFSDKRRAIASGVPDLYAMHPAKRRDCWVEVKAPGGKLRPEQVTFRDVCAKAGVEWWLVDDVQTVREWA